MFQLLLPLLSEGLLTTGKVFFITLIFSLPLSILVAVGRQSTNSIVSGILSLYIYLMRGTPLLLQLMFIFFGLPMIPGIGLTLDRFTAIYVAFVLNYAAYFGEILRGGIQSIEQGQWEGAKVLGFSRTYSFFHIILPQALQRVIPAISNEVITLVKDTSLVYILGVTDLLKAARTVSNTMSSILPYVAVGLLYLVIIFIVSKILFRMEKAIRL